MRLVHERARDHEAALHAARKGARNRVAAVPELQLLQIGFGALFRERALDAVEAGLVHDDRECGLKLIEVDLLRHDADAGFRGFEFAIDVVAEYLDVAAGLVDQGGHDADRRRLAGAIGAEQREEVALLDGQIDALERLDAVLVSLGELAKD